jgi:hypothetical protein
VVAAVNRHQLTDKGFGAALGPEAVATAITAFERVGYEVMRGPSDWQFGPADREIATEVIVGWASAAREIGEPRLTDLLAWVTGRRSLIESGRSTVRVGHVDFFARPMGTR